MSDNQIRTIEGLSTLTNLRVLYLTGNRITKIEGLDALGNLVSLLLNNNRISKLEGLENLHQLGMLSLDNTDIPSSVLDECGGVETADIVEGLMRNTQQCVAYCRRNKAREGRSHRKG